MKKPPYLLAAVVLIGSVSGGVAHSQTLEEALTAAYNNNPTLLAERARLRSTDELVPQALAGWRPTVRLAADAGKSRVDSNTAVVTNPQTRTPRSLALQLSQPVYDGGRTPAAIEQSENTVRSGQAQLSATEQAVLLSAATAYMNVVRDQAVLELNINNVQVLRRQLEAARDRFRVGEITRTDVSQSEARVARSIADRVAAEGNLQASRAAFQNVVGIMPERLMAPTVVGELPASLPQAVELAATQNPAVVATRYAAAAAADGIDVVKAETLPDVTLSGGLSRNYDAVTTGSRSDVAQATVNLTVPLYQAGADYSRVRQQKHVANQRRIETDQERRDAIETAARAWEALQAAQAQITSFRAQIEASEIALEGVQREAQVGSRTVLDVLDAEQELLDSRVNLVRAQRDEGVAAVQLKSAIGRMTAQGLGLPVEVYNPARNYETVRGRWIGTDIEPVAKFEE